MRWYTCFCFVVISGSVKQEQLSLMAVVYIPTYVFTVPITKQIEGMGNELCCAYAPCMVWARVRGYLNTLSDYSRVESTLWDLVKISS